MSGTTFVIWGRHVASAALSKAVFREFAAVFRNNNLLGLLLVLDLNILGTFFALNYNTVCLEGDLGGSLG